MLETSEELRAALVQGLDTLVAISYVDDDEVGAAVALGTGVWEHRWKASGGGGLL